MSGRVLPQVHCARSAEVSQTWILVDMSRSAAGYEKVKGAVIKTCAEGNISSMSAKSCRHGHMTYISMVDKANINLYSSHTEIDWSQDSLDCACGFEKPMTAQNASAPCDQESIVSTQALVCVQSSSVLDLKTPTKISQQNVFKSLNKFAAPQHDITTWQLVLISEWPYGRHWFPETSWNCSNKTLRHNVCLLSKLKLCESSSLFFTASD